MNIASTLGNTIHTTAKKTLGAALLAGTLLLAPGFQTAAHARVFFSVSIAPPAIPVYEQPLCPGDGYIWTPGYWAWTDDGYQWIDGAWVTAPYAGALWTPGYWGYNDGAYLWNAGYWGREVGYYGGINYGFGYFGTGFYGGYWAGDRFLYNRAYNRFDRGFRGEFYERREHGYDGRPGGEAFARNDRGFHDDHRGSFAGGRDFHDEHREAFNGNRPSGGNFDQQRGFAGQQNGNQNLQNDYRRGFQGGQDNRAVSQPQQTFTQPRQIPSQQPAQSFGGNRQGYQNDISRQPQQGFSGYQNPGANRATYNPQQYRPAPTQSFGGRQSGNPGGFQSNAIRSNNTPSVANYGGGRGYQAPAAPQQNASSFRATAPSANQGGGFHGGDNHGGHR